MPSSLLIHCSRKDAEQVRTKAKLERRTVSSYVMNIVMRAVEFDERLVVRLGLSPLFKVSGKAKVKGVAPKTTLHIYCTMDEAKRVRQLATLRGITISGFVVGSLRRAWEIESSMKLRRLHR
jgi:hypothetical protein